jgi:hypothetical protein
VFGSITAEIPPTMRRQHSTIAQRTWQRWQSQAVAVLTSSFDVSLGEGGYGEAVCVLAQAGGASLGELTRISAIGM